MASISLNIFFSVKFYFSSGSSHPPQDHSCGLRSLKMWTLPHPDGPMKAVILCSSICMLISFNAWKAPVMQIQLFDIKFRFYRCHIFFPLKLSYAGLSCIVSAVRRLLTLPRRNSSSLSDGSHIAPMLNARTRIIRTAEAVFASALS